MVKKLSNRASALPQAIQWREGKLFLLDQTRLPLEIVIEEQKTAQDVWQAIKILKVRGAPAIGVTAAYGLCVALRDKTTLDMTQFRRELKKEADYLNSARPTAVNLSWALKRMQSISDRSGSVDASTLYREIVSEACAIHSEDQQLCRGMGSHGAELIRHGMGILTHCNAGAMATSGIGTATAPMYIAHEKGIEFRVYADETRPLLQGARITAWELDRSELDVTLITDNMAAHIMSQGLIDMVLVGTDRVATNGDVANKIGTLGLAILAKHYKVPFYVACPSSTYDRFSISGKDIVIEERDTEEVTNFAGKRVASPEIQVRNPAFDVTPAELVTALITEKGIVRAPFRENMEKVLNPASNP